MEAIVALVNAGKKSKEREKGNGGLKKLEGRFQQGNYTLLAPEVMQSHQQLNSAIRDMQIDFMMTTSESFSGHSTSFSGLGVHEINRSSGTLFGAP
jgi:hypothetical protein